MSETFWSNIGLKPQEGIVDKFKPSPNGDTLIVRTSDGRIGTQAPVHNGTKFVEETNTEIAQAYILLLDSTRQVTAGN